MNASSLSIVLPCYNEEENIAKTATEVHDWLKANFKAFEVIAVNDGSKDKTMQVLRKLESSLPNLKTLDLPSNQGYGGALIAGIDAATSELVGFMDSDGQFIVEDFAKLIPLLEEAEIATGIRTNRADPFPRKVNALAYRTILRGLFGVVIPDVNCGMKVFRRDIWSKVRPTTATGGIFNGEVFARARKHGFTWKWAPVRHLPRFAGTQTGANPKVIIKSFKELLELRTKL